MLSSTIHPGWQALLDWLKTHHIVGPLFVEPRLTPGAGYGLFSTKELGPSSPLFTIPASALMNSLTLDPHYPPAQPKLSCTQIISLHLLLHRPSEEGTSTDPLFGPYISVLPQHFDCHPLTWLWRENHSCSTTLETTLLANLPPAVSTKLHRIHGLFKKDWNRIQEYLRKNAEIFAAKSPLTGISDHSNAREKDYLWAWLNVNTRCIYHRICKSRTDADNMTLCPILDFANHVLSPPFTTPQTSHGELWDTGPSSKRRFGDNFVLLSPTNVVTEPGSELYLRYGLHSNPTLFTEYGFVHAEEKESLEAETELDCVLERMFMARGEIGEWMRDRLVEEGYWGDWTMHLTPAPAHPSYRLITALRLYHAIPESASALPPNLDRILEDWQNTTLGKQVAVSESNERLWRGTLLEICEELERNGEGGIAKIRREIGSETHKRPHGMRWIETAQRDIEILWREEITVGRALAISLREGLEF